MDKSRPVAERVRPILQAMERSIDAARRQRLNHDSGPARAPEPHRDGSPDGNGAPNTPPARLKARPKRSNGFRGYPNDLDYRSRAS
jgi:hypothetical protein